MEEPLVRSASRGPSQPHPQLFSAAPKRTSVSDRRQSADPARDPSLAALSGLIVAVTAASHLAPDKEAPGSAPRRPEPPLTKGTTGKITVFTNNSLTASIQTAKYLPAGEALPPARAGEGVLTLDARARNDG